MRPLKVYKLYWAPEGRQVAVVRASTAVVRASTAAIAVKKTPKPWSEVYAEATVKEAV